MAEKTRADIVLNAEDEDIKWSSDEESSPNIKDNEVVFAFHESVGDDGSTSTQNKPESIDQEVDLSSVTEVVPMSANLEDPSSTEIVTIETPLDADSVRNGSPTISSDQRCGSSFAIVTSPPSNETTTPTNTGGEEAEKGDDWGDWD